MWTDPEMAAPGTTGLVHDTSHPGISVMPTRSAAARASDSPIRLSWSVRATALHPAAAASSGIRVGVSDPSETREWVCRSITGRGYLHGRLGLAVDEQRDEGGAVRSR